MSHAVANAVRACWNNHFYTFRGNIYEQVDGGAIGLDLTGEIVRLVMAVWHIEFLKRMKDTGIYLTCTNPM